jgi:hypothetical protein
MAPAPAVPSSIGRDAFAAAIQMMPFARRSILDVIAAMDVIAQKSYPARCGA